MRILVTGGAGFIGSHAAEFFAKKGNEVIVLDNLSRAGTVFNWQKLGKCKGVERIEGDILDKDKLAALVGSSEAIIHAAGQTAVITSVTRPDFDFSENLVGTFRVLEAARLCGNKTIIFCSTNKVYGENINRINVAEEGLRYAFQNRYRDGIPESFPIDHCAHTPYGCSKLCADLYMQEYTRLYGLRIGVFRMSCIYGERQFGIEDQGWVAWFTIATILGKPIIVYGNGRQVRDILFIDDLVLAYNKFIQNPLAKGVFNVGGGPHNTISLLELLNLLKEVTGKRTEIKFADWRPGDQKVYISDIGKVSQSLNWSPKTSVEEGVKKLVDWTKTNDKMLYSMYFS